MATIPDELEKYIKEPWNILLERLYKPMGMATWWTTSSTTSSSSTYYYDSYIYNNSPRLNKNGWIVYPLNITSDEYIPSDEPGRERKLKDDFKFNPEFLMLEE